MTPAAPFGPEIQYWYDRIHSQDDRLEKELDNNVIADEIERLNRKIVQYNSEPIGGMTTDKENGRIRIFFGQLNNMSTEAVRKIKIKAIKYIEKNMTQI